MRRQILVSAERETQTETNYSCFSSSMGISLFKIHGHEGTHITLASLQTTLLYLVADWKVMGDKFFIYLYDFHSILIIGKGGGWLGVSNISPFKTRRHWCLETSGLLRQLACDDKSPWLVFFLERLFLFLLFIEVCFSTLFKCFLCQCHLSFFSFL